jgi:hypothetical protein
MKNVIKVFSSVLIFVLISSFNIQSNTYSSSHKTHKAIGSEVYICGGQYGKKFHSYSNCRGLNNCKGGVYKVSSQSEAKSKGYSACSICWK